MIEIYANEVRATRPGKEWVKGWKHLDGEGIHRRDIAAANMAWRTYNDARNRWRNAPNELDHARCAPKLDFFLAITRACEQRWQLKQPGSLDRRLLGELQLVSKDMAEFKIPLLERVYKKLDLEPTIQLYEADTIGPKMIQRSPWPRCGSKARLQGQKRDIHLHSGQYLTCLHISCCINTALLLLIRAPAIQTLCADIFLNLFAD